MKKTYLLIGIAVAITLAVGGIVVRAAVAGQNAVTGWGWASNIGWISFSSLNSGAGSGGTYGVNVDDVGNFNGYAWSPNVGWLSFNYADLATAPACNQTGAANRPHVATSTGAVSGWVRFIAGATTAVNKTEGWDGCVNLADTTYHPTGFPDGTRGVTYSTTATQGNFRGFSWGGEVVGWLSFSPTIPIGACTPGAPGCGGTGCVPGSPGCTDPGCPTCGGGGGGPVTITGSCSATAGVTSAVYPGTLTLPAGGGAVTFQASPGAPNPGTPPYTYSWNGGAYVASNQTSVSYTTAGTYSGQYFGVRDSGVNVGTIMCPTVVVGNGGVSNTITVLIGTTPTSASTNQLQIAKGTDFVLKWSVPAAYDLSTDCTVTASKVSGVGNVDTNWTSGAVSNNWRIGSVQATNPGNTAYLHTDVAGSGIYEFDLMCSNGTAGASTGFATLRITDSNVDEI